MSTEVQIKEKEEIGGPQWFRGWDFGYKWQRPLLHVIPHLCLPFIFFPLSPSNGGKKGPINNCFGTVKGTINL